MAVDPVGSAPRSVPGAASPSGNGNSFVDDLVRMIQEANQSQVDAAHTAERLMVKGRNRGVVRGLLGAGRVIGAALRS